MRLRQQSQLGWGLLQWLGETSLPHVTRDAQKRAETKLYVSTGGPNYTEIFYRCGHPYRRYVTAKPLRRTMDHDCPDCAAAASARPPEPPPPEPPPPEPHAQPPGDTVEDDFCTKLEACHCASPEHPIGSGSSAKAGTEWLNSKSSRRSTA